MGADCEIFQWTFRGEYEERQQCLESIIREPLMISKIFPNNLSVATDSMT